MKIKALSTIIAFDGAMVVINAGETGELRDDLAEQEIAAGKAQAVKGKAQAVKAEEPAPADEAPTEETAP